MKKRYITKKKNGTMVTSKIEQKIFDYLLKKFPDTINHYHSELYPFACDFYIPKLDLYIEYNGHWKHGKEPYNSKNKKHQMIVEKWLQKSKEQDNNGKYKLSYLDAIENWTKKDVLKRETAYLNNLNYLEFWNEKDFLVWYNSIN